MKVMCVKAGAWNGACIKECKPHIAPSFGEICTVVGREVTGSVTYYNLEEYGGLENFWNSNHFIPLSDIDELELIEQRLCTA